MQLILFLQLFLMKFFPSVFINSMLLTVRIFLPLEISKLQLSYGRHNYWKRKEREQKQAQYRKSTRKGKSKKVLLDLLATRSFVSSFNLVNLLSLSVLRKKHSQNMLKSFPLAHVFCFHKNVLIRIFALMRNKTFFPKVLA